MIAPCQGRPVVLSERPEQNEQIARDLEVQRAIGDKLGEFLKITPPTDGSIRFSSQSDPTRSVKVTLAQLLEAGGPAGLFKKGVFDDLLSEEQKRQVVAAGDAAGRSVVGCLPPVELPRPQLPGGREPTTSGGCFPGGSGPVTLPPEVLKRLKELAPRLRQLAPAGFPFGQGPVAAPNFSSPTNGCSPAGEPE